MLGAGKLRFCCRKIENGRQDDTWYLVMVMDAGALYGRMYGVFSSICSLLSVTVLMCAVFIFSILMAYRRYNEGLRQAAYTDALTGGSNFSGFLMKVNNAEGGYMVSVSYTHLLRPQQVKRFLPEEKIVTYQDAMQAVLRQTPIDGKKRNILRFHQFITGAVKSDSE